jgi:hypothetical protein
VEKNVRCAWSVPVIVKKVLPHNHLRQTPVSTSPALTVPQHNSDMVEALTAAAASSISATPEAFASRSRCAIHQSTTRGPWCRRPCATVQQMETWSSRCGRRQKPPTLQGSARTRLAFHSQQSNELVSPERTSIVYLLHRAFTEPSCSDGCASGVDCCCVGYNEANEHAAQSSRNPKPA